MAAAEEKTTDKAVLLAPEPETKGRRPKAKHWRQGVLKNSRDAAFWILKRTPVTAG